MDNSKDDLGVTPPTDIEKAQLDFLWKQHSYISDFVKFGDAKAGLLIPLNVGCVAALLTSSSPFRAIFLVHSFSRATSSQAIAMAGLLCLICSVCCSAWTIFPRFKTGPEIGPISWIEISCFTTHDHFVRAATSLHSEKAVRLMAQQVYYMAKVCKRKNRLIQISLIFSLIGFVLLGGLVVINR